MTLFVWALAVVLALILTFLELILVKLALDREVR
jgi:hypothetical protein